MNDNSEDHKCWRKRETFNEYHDKKTGIRVEVSKTFLEHINGKTGQIDHVKLAMTQTETFDRNGVLCSSVIEQFSTC